MVITWLSKVQGASTTLEAVVGKSLYLAHSFNEYLFRTYQMCITALDAKEDKSDVQLKLLVLKQLIV